MRIKRTQKAIVDRFLQRKKMDPLGFEIYIYLDYMTYRSAKPFLKPSTTKEEWNKAIEKIKTPRREIKKYMPFAWDKANGCRGISSNRSIMHFIAWIWLDGKDDFANEIEKLYMNEYQYYGKDILVRICEEYGIDSKKFDDGERRNTDAFA